MAYDRGRVTHNAPTNFINSHKPNIFKNIVNISKTNLSIFRQRLRRIEDAIRVSRPPLHEGWD